MPRNLLGPVRTGLRAPANAVERRIVRFRLQVLVMVLVLASFGPAIAHAQDGPVHVVTTIGMIADVARNVGGTCVDVKAIMGPGVDPHLYQASARDVVTLRDADVILYSGYGLEGQLGDVLDRFAEQQPTVAVAPRSITTDELLSMENLHGIDPHVWMDVSLWAKTAPTIAAALTELAPGCADEFEANAQAYVAELAALHAWIGSAIATIPEHQRMMVTAHDAFGYYGRAYDIEVAGIQGISTASEAGIADIRAMARLVADRDVPVVFVETTINPRTIQAVVDAVRHLGHEVRIGDQLYSDAMGEDGTYGGTYIGMLYTNTVHIAQALGGDVPPLPDGLDAWAARWGLP